MSADRFDRLTVQIKAVQKAIKDLHADRERALPDEKHELWVAVESAQTLFETFSCQIAINSTS